MLEWALLGDKRRARWPMEAEEEYKIRLKRMGSSHWTAFMGNAGGVFKEADAENPLGHLEGTQSFSNRTGCRYCNFCTARHPHHYMDAAFDGEMQTGFGAVHVYTTGRRDKCADCPFPRCDCDRPVAFAVRTIPSALVLSLDFRYLPGQSLRAIATTISGREVGRLALDLQRPATTNLNSSSLHLLAAGWAIGAGLLQSKQQKIELVVGLRLLKASPTTVLWSEEAERGPPRFRLRSKTNLRALRWQRYMETLCQPPPQAGMGRRPEETA